MTGMGMGSYAKKFRPKKFKPTSLIPHGAQGSNPGFIGPTRDAHTPGIPMGGQGQQELLKQALIRRLTGLQ